MNTPTCPWCGKTADKYPSAKITREWGSKVYVKKGRPRVKTKERWLYNKKGQKKILVQESLSTRLGRRFKARKSGRYNMIICAHPFHDVYPHHVPEPEPVLQIPPRVHHPDLTRMKKKLKRDLQNKDRR
jgi:hypothetical protein